MLYTVDIYIDIQKNEIITQKGLLSFLFDGEFLKRGQHAMQSICHEPKYLRMLNTSSRSLVNASAPTLLSTPLPSFHGPPLQQSFKSSVNHPGTFARLVFPHLPSWDKLRSSLVFYPHMGLWSSPFECSCKSFSGTTGRRRLGWIKRASNATRGFSRHHGPIRYIWA